MRTPKEPVALFEGPRLAWFRGWPLVLVIAAAVGLGVVLDRAVVEIAAALEARRARAAHGPSSDPATAARRLAPSTLRGPDGAVATLPPERASIVHVWLQGCADCMPAFEAAARLRDQPSLSSLPTINVAYGSASPEFAVRYGVDRGLVFDGGDAVVRPLGIGSFTTLVVAPDGLVVHRDRPDRPGYVDRVVAAHGAADAMARAASPACAPTPR